MGRTVLTFREILENERKKWRKFKDALRKDEREAFEEILKDCEIHVAESSQSKSPNPFREMVMSVLLEQRKEINSIKEEIDELIESKEDE